MDTTDRPDRTGPLDQKAPRIAPASAPPEGTPPLNIFATLAKHPDLFERFSRFGGFLLYKGLLPAREREVVILRVGWRSGSVYEFGQHTVIAQRAGLTDGDVRRLASEGLEGWSDEDRDLVELADQLCTTNTLDDALWGRLAGRWSEPELIELLLLAGFYRLVSGFLNATGVQPEDGVPGWPA